MKKVLTGMRPTGFLHIGHWEGNLKNMVELQETYQCYYFVADWHALTTAYEDPGDIPRNTREMVLDWLSAGIDPSKAVVYRQSDIRELAEFGIYLSLITPVSWLERSPTYKEMVQELKGKEIATLGFLGYPVWQTADITAVHAEIVPVGEDQLPHLELAREIVRRFNTLYGEYLVEPHALLSPAARVPGTDGRKMSKSFGNAIFLTDTPDEIRSKLKTMVTDPQRVRKTDPGRPAFCPVFTLHNLYSQKSLEVISERCRGAAWGCIDCKAMLSENLIEALRPLQAKRKELENTPEIVNEILAIGGEKIKTVVGETLNHVRSALRLI